MVGETGFEPARKKCGYCPHAPTCTRCLNILGRLADPLSTQATEILDVALETSAKVAGLDRSDRSKYVAEAARALEEFRQQQQKLTELAKGAGRRATKTIADAAQQVQQLHAELARSLSQGLGLAGLRAIK
jgi:MoxR-like ATPase